MKALIANKLTSIWEEVQKQLEKEGWQHGAITDPIDLLQQRLFLLKYYPSYLHEYYLVANKVIEDSLIKEPINVISFRSGSAIDYDAFYGAVKDKNNFSYIGVEPNLWSDYNGVPTHSLSWIWSELVELEELNMEEQNVFLFPKSLSFMSYKEIEALKRFIQTGQFNRKSICIAFSAQNPDDIAYEHNRFESVVNTFKKWQKYEISEQIIMDSDGSLLVDGEKFEYPPRLYSYLMAQAIPKKWAPERRLSKFYCKLVCMKKSVKD